MIYFTSLETRDFYSGLEKTDGNYTACNFAGKEKDYMCKTFHYSEFFDFPHYVGDEGVVLHLSLYKHKRKPDDYIIRCGIALAIFNAFSPGEKVTKEGKYINIHLSTPKVKIKKEVEIKDGVGRVSFIINGKYNIQLEAKDGFCIRRRVNLYKNNKLIDFESIRGA